MNLSNFRVEKLIQEDSFQRFSTGYLDDNPAEINLISIKNPASILTTTRLLIADHLYNVIDVFEEQNELHILLTQPLGVPLESYLSQSDASNELYDQRIYLGLSLLKALNKYDTFSNAIKYQLLADNQILIHDSVICFRELVDYTTISHHSFKDVIFRLSRLLERLVKPETEIHQQFMDNLSIGNHHYYTISELLNDYKNIFIYEKPESLSKVAYEYHIILNQSDQGSSLSKLSELTFSESTESTEGTEIVAPESPEILIDTTKPKIMDFEIKLTEEPVEKEISSTPFDSLSDSEEPFAESELLRSELSKLLFMEEVSLNTDTLTLNQPLDEDMDATFAEIRRAHKSNSPPDNIKHTLNLPKWDDDQSITENDTLIEDIFTPEDLEPVRWKKIIFPLMTTITLIAIIFLASKFLLGNNTTLKASYKIDALDDNRVAFINTSPNLKNADHCEWTIYYDHQLIETYNSEHFYPIFDTQGRYEIVLRIMDKDGNWSESFKQEYDYLGESENSSSTVEN